GFRMKMIAAGYEDGNDANRLRRDPVFKMAQDALPLYEDVYCRRGAAENIKSWKTHLAADRTSCTRATANQFRLFLHAGAYWLMWGLRAAMPRRSSFAVAQFDTLRLRLIKIAARVVEMKSQIRLHLPTSCPDQRILRIVVDRIPQLAT
ncbi:transposase, partial [Mesorhizobium sp. M0976]|uniref:transposase n=1 Tax=Mesorhizobium sp. M0976 TaxID=2957038 RepID=UPI00333D30B4